MLLKGGGDGWKVVMMNRARKLKMHEGAGISGDRSLIRQYRRDLMVKDSKL